jgi:hypothetical protein
MAAPHREVVNQIWAWILDEVQAASGWTAYVEEPQTPPLEPALAVWWDNGVPLPSENTTAVVGGWLGTLDTYGIQYTEPAPDGGARLLRDEDNDESMEQNMTAVVGVIFNHTRDLPPPNHDMRWAAHQKLPGTRTAVVGWQITVQVRRPVDFS